MERRVLDGKGIMKIMVVLGLIVILVQPSGVISAAREKILTIGCGPLGASFMVSGGGLAAYLTNVMDGCVVTARLTGGSVENIRLVSTRQTDLGFTTAEVAYKKIAGIDIFKGQASRDFQWVSQTTVAAYHWITLEKSGIKSMRDLEGKRVAIGQAGSGTAMSAEEVLKAYGIFNKAKIVRLPFAESAESLKDGHLDAISIGSAPPFPVLIDLCSVRKVRLISLDKQVLTTILNEAHYYIEYTIPAGTYSGVNEEAKVIGVATPIIAHKDVTKERVYELTKHMFDPKAQNHMKTVYAGWDLQSGIEAARRIGVSLHPGAEQYFREAGILK